MIMGAGKSENLQGKTQARDSEKIWCFGSRWQTPLCPGMTCEGRFLSRPSIDQVTPSPPIMPSNLISSKSIDLDLNLI